MWQYMAKVHHTGDFCTHIFSESHYPKLLIATCWHSECGGFIDSRHVIRGLLFKFVDFLYSRSEVFDLVIKVVSSENIFFSLSFDV